MRVVADPRRASPSSPSSARPVMASSSRFISRASPACGGRSSRRRSLRRRPGPRALGSRGEQRSAIAARRRVRRRCARCRSAAPATPRGCVEARSSPSNGGPVAVRVVHRRRRDRAPSAVPTAVEAISSMSSATRGASRRRTTPGPRRPGASGEATRMRVSPPAGTSRRPLIGCGGRGEARRLALRSSRPIRARLAGPTTLTRSQTGPSVRCWR